MNRRNLVMITDPLGGAKDRPSSSASELAAMEEEMRTLDLCGRSWADPPLDMAELIFSTFKPIFCSGRDGDVSLRSLAGSVHWLVLSDSGFETVLPRTEGGDLAVPPSRPSLLIICSNAACRRLFGKSMARIFAAHIRRDDAAGERSGMTVGEIGSPVRSPLAGMFSDIDGTEVVLVPLPSVNGGRAKLKVQYVPGERVEELRTDYVRRVHKELGCDKHSKW
ncbi:MAG: hypothetical protein LLG16_06285 [Euryarchaeota archaeon]|nr:hypothetical protein [Euryarchaeota archaeon]